MTAHTEGQTTTEAKRMPDKLATAISGARESFRALHGNCSMCAVGDVPAGGLHRGEHKCGNEAIQPTTGAKTP